MSTWIKGIPTSEQIVIGKAYCLKKPDFECKRRTIADYGEELQRFNFCLNEAIRFVKNVRDFFEQEKTIYDELLFLLQDGEWIDSIKALIQNEKVNAAFAIHEVTESFIHLKSNQSDENRHYLYVREAEELLLAKLFGIPVPNPGLLMEEVILVTDRLSPVIVAQMNKKFCSGIVVDNDSYPVNVHLFAQVLEIPAVIVDSKATTEIINGDLLILDGSNGQVHINPTEELLEKYKTILKQT